MKETSTLPVETTTTLLETTTAMKYEETTIVNNKPYEFQSNFSRNNDSVFVSFYSNSSNVFVSINNTFMSTKYDQFPCDIVFTEHAIYPSLVINTKIMINFNGIFTRDLATQLGDRLLDMADLLLTVRSMKNQTVETV